MKERNRVRTWFLLGVLGFIAVLLVAARVCENTNAVPKPASADLDAASADLDACEVPADAGVEVEVEYQSYAIHGSSLFHLCRDLGRLGPKDSQGRHNALTRYYVRWTYQHDYERGRCSIRAPKVAVTITITMPKWEPESDAPPSLITDWHEYERALRLHEDGHKQYACRAARDILAKLQTLPSEHDCEAMDREANTRANTILEEYKSRHRTYDRYTGHGFMQRARFPW